MHTILPKILEESLEVATMKRDLARMRAFDAALGHPSRQFRSVHIAGTNGKGSVATKIASGYPGKGIGLFTSPHITSYRERVQIDEAWIPEKTAQKLLEKIISTVSEEPTYFELLTLLAFIHFAEQNVELAVIEVGMGGRLDATNIITPELSVITSIALDHTRHLGDTIEEIAREKGGIIKPDIPVVVGPQACFYPNAIEVTGPFLHYEEENQAIAQKALQLLGVSDPDVSKVPPCRFEQHGRVIFDVAHNPEALQRTFERIPSHQKVRVLAAFSSEKDISACLEVIKKYAVAYHLIRGAHPRLAQLESALTMEEALQHVQPGELILVCGSFFIMEEARSIVR